MQNRVKNEKELTQSLIILNRTFSINTISKYHFKMLISKVQKIALNKDNNGDVNRYNFL